jgi:hypothetical protein
MHLFMLGLGVGANYMDGAKTTMLFQAEHLDFEKVTQKKLSTNFAQFLVPLYF